MGAAYYTLSDAESQRFMNEVPFSLSTDANDWKDRHHHGGRLDRVGGLHHELVD
jgi:hypothetical protein